MKNDQFAATTFAGFTLPRVVRHPTYHTPATVGGASLARRLETFKRDRAAGYRRTGATTYPNRIRHAGGPDGFGLYDTDQGETLAGLRAVHASEFSNHIPDGYYLDADGIGDTLQPLVMRLPAGRGFLAGWSMGDGMAATIGYAVYQDETDAAHAADGEAETTAEAEREYQESEREETEKAEAEAEAKARAEALETVREALDGNAEALAALRVIAA